MATKRKSRKSQWSLKQQYMDNLFAYSKLNENYDYRLLLAKDADEMERVVRQYREAKKELETSIKFLKEQIEIDRNLKIAERKYLTNTAIGAAEAGIAVYTGIKSVEIDTNNEIARNRTSKDIFRFLSGLLSKTRKL